MPTVETAHGRIRGRDLPAGGAAFTGIPFAASPVGALRLRPPAPVEPWAGELDATLVPAAPMQDTTAVGSAELVSEDCLYLSVWTPGTEGPHPVLVWLYGGGFEVGSGAPPVTDGAALARRTGTVVVAPNYRVGALGYLHLADLGGPRWAGSTNLGLQDQVAALRWVAEHVAAFGGDPGNVTVAGESAGGFSTGALLALPAAKGTFGRAIMQSGTTGRIFTAELATRIAADLIAALGLDSVDGLLEVPAARIVEAQLSVIDTDIGARNLPGGRSYGVVLDGVVLPEHPHQLVEAGGARELDLLVSTTRDELRVFQLMQAGRYAPADEDALLDDIRRAGMPRPEVLLASYRQRTGYTDLADLRTAFLTDALYRRPAVAVARAQVEAGGRAYTCLFAAEPWGPEIGAGHGTDLPYVFDNLGAGGAIFSAADTPANRTVRDEVAAAWAGFAATGDPGWPVHRADAPGNTRLFGGATAMTTEPPPDVVTAAWAAGCSYGCQVAGSSCFVLVSAV